MHSNQGYSAIIFPFMPGPILSLQVLVSMTFFMIIVLITNGYRGYVQGMASCDYLIFLGYLPYNYHDLCHDTLVAKT